MMNILNIVFFILHAPMMPLFAILSDFHRGDDPAESSMRANIVLAAYGVAIYFVLFFPVIHEVFLK